MRDVALYKRVVDGMVEECQSGQGQIGPGRARAGVWNCAATPSTPLENQWHINQLLATLSDEQREVLAELLADQFVSGMHAALVVLHANQVSPFEDGYEGDPVHDFTGRLDGWPWPRG